MIPLTLEEFKLQSKNKKFRTLLESASSMIHPSVNPNIVYYKNNNMGEVCVLFRCSDNMVNIDENVYAPKINVIIERFLYFLNEMYSINLDKNKISFVVEKDTKNDIELYWFDLDYFKDNYSTIINENDMFNIFRDALYGYKAISEYYSPKNINENSLHKISVYLKINKLFFNNKGILDYIISKFVSDVTERGFYVNIDDISIEPTSQDSYVDKILPSYGIDDEIFDEILNNIMKTI